MTRNPQLFSLLAFFLISDGLRASAACVEFFASSSEREHKSGTDDLIAYLATLLEQQILGEAELRRIIAGGEAGEIVNPITEKKAAVDTAALLHRNEIQEYLDSSVLDHAEILRWSKEKLKTMELVKIQRKDTRNKTEEIHQRMVFHPIPPGKFRMGERGKSRIFELTHNIEMMSTLVTQRHWVDLMGKNPSTSGDLDHPVADVTWWAAIVFANRLSEKRGLKPAYDFSEILFKGSAEKGTLYDWSVKGELKIDAPDGDIYQTEGYRLPTKAEQEYVRRNLGQAKGAYYFGANENKLKDYAWYVENSGKTTHPVAELKPFLVAGWEFYDLYGNLQEWSHNFPSDILSDCRQNPAGPLSGISRVLCGGSYSGNALSCRSASFSLADPNRPYEDVGFRLVRTIH